MEDESAEPQKQTQYWIALYMVTGLLIMSGLALLPPQVLQPVLTVPGSLLHLAGFGLLVFVPTILQPKSIRWIIPIAVILGGAIELIQPYFDRSSQFGDIVANAFGCVLSACLGLIWLRFKPSNEPE